MARIDLVEITDLAAEPDFAFDPSAPGILA